MRGHALVNFVVEIIDVLPSRNSSAKQRSGSYGPDAPTTAKQGPFAPCRRLQRSWLPTRVGRMTGHTVALEIFLAALCLLLRIESAARYIVRRGFRAGKFGIQNKLMKSADVRRQILTHRQSV